MLGKIKKTILIFDPRKRATAVGKQIDLDSDTANFRNMCQLEDRILYSASPIGVSAELPIEQVVSDSVTYHDFAQTDPIVADDQVSSADFLPPPPFGSNHELFVIDSRVENLSELLNEHLSDESLNASIIDISSETDGVLQLTEILESYTDLTAIHLFSHGESGAIQLGNTQLSAETFESYSDQIETWGQALKEEGDILIYGCEVAAGPDGQWLIKELATTTSADISASTDITGHSDLGGNWILETTIGSKPELPNWLSAVDQTWHSTLGVVASPDSFSTNENDELSVDSESGVLANDILETTGGTIAQSSELNFDASLDLTTNQTWENTSGIPNFDFNLSPSITNNPVIDGPPSVTSAYLFDGVASATLTSTFADLTSDPTTEAVSFETWFRPTSGVISDAYLFEIGSLNSGINLSIFTDNTDGATKLAFTVNGTQSIAVVSDISSEVLSGSFIQAITTFDPLTGTAELFVNGSLVGSETNSSITDWSDSTDSPSLGNSSGNTKVISGQSIFSGFRGEISSFSFYRALLSNAEIEQDYTASTSFLSVANYDAVSQQNGTISMETDGSFIYDPGDNFDYLTGTETATDTFDYTVTDNIGNSETTTVQVLIVGQNDSPNNITFSNTTIDENTDTTGGYTVTNLFTSDADTNDTFIYSIVGGTDSGKFTITGSELKLADGLIDFETQASYSVQVETKDADNATFQKTFTLNVNNLDDTAPTITSANNVAVDENSPPSQIIYTATADDSADVSNGVTFAISGTDAANFSIDPNTGEVAILASPDAETKDSYQFDIVATDVDGNASDPHSVLLSINNLDDTAPIISSATNVAVDENIPPNQIIYTATADDSADVSNGFTFAISGTDAASFSIDQNTGDVSLLASPDAETKDSYQFDIIATDDAGNGSDPFTVTLSINNLDDTAPVITSANNVAVDENIPPNQIVYTAAADDSADVSNGVSFAISGTDAASFSIDQNTGDVSLLASPDAETKDSYQFDIIATDDAGNGSDPFTVTLSINNLDDTAPIITSANNVAVDENIPPNQIVYTAAADDSADVSNGVSFAISGTDAASFSIDPNTGDVSLLASPDAEAKDTYQFKIIATDDAGNESAPFIVTLNINNLDDTAPIISSATNVAVDENIPANQIVYTAAADDSADVSNGVSFAISGTDAASFSIDPNTGDVSLLASPDAETKDSYQFDIIATDDDGNASDPHSVLLSINNLDDTAPVITSANNVAVDENIPANQIVYTAAADDFADVSNGVSFAISGTDAASFSIDQNTGDVSLLASPDAETKDSYQFDIIATDDAGNGSDPHSVLLNINNLDDTAPIITSATNVAVDENIPPNQIIYTATADDSADVSNGFTFAISGTDAASFSIDPNTGEVSLLASPDAETKDSYQFDIIATDDAGNGSDPHSVLLSINNLDDTAPIITSATNVAVDENIPANQIVYTATADDSADVSNGVTFAISGTDAASFSIDPNTGDVSLLASPDAENKATYNFTIVATDGADNASIPLNVILNVNDLNESPTAISPGVVNILSGTDTTNGIKVADLETTDPDTGDAFTYSVVNDLDSGHFDLTDNVLFFDAGIVNGLLKPSYDIRIQVTDLGGNVFESTFTINVTQTNQPPSGITPDKILIDENIDTAGGYDLGPLSTIDPDVFETFTYSIIPGLDASHFTLGGTQSSQLIFDDGSLDYETKSNYSVTIKVIDSQGNELESTLSVQIVDVNETPSSISLSSSIIPENSDVINGFAIGDLQASDEDFGDTHSYEITGGDDQNNFSLGGPNGATLILSDLLVDFEAQPTYQVKITATDSGGAQIQETIIINVEDQNDAPSGINPTDFSIAENQGSDTGIVLGSLTTIDQDANDSFTYSIIGGVDANSFQIGGNLNDQLILTEANIDYEAKDSYSVTIRTTDTSFAQYESTITVMVVDQNEAPLELTPVEFSILENTQASFGLEIGNLHADDPDFNESFTFSILNGFDSGYFSITGTKLFFTHDSIDYEQNATYQTSILVEDSGGHQLEELITVNIIDENEAPSDLLNTEFHITDNTDAATGRSLGTLNAVDPDAGETFAYEILGGNDPSLFSIGGANNDELILTATTLDSAIQPLLSVDVKVTDSGGNFYTETIDVNIVSFNSAVLPRNPVSDTPNATDDSALELTDSETTVTETENTSEVLTVETINDSQATATIAAKPVQMDVGMIQGVTSVTRFDRSPNSPN